MKVCKQCGTVGEPVNSTPGSMAIELVLWLCFLIPGLIYSLWRLSRRHSVCRACGSKDLVPVNTPVGQAIAGDRAVPQHSAPSGAESFGRWLGRTLARKK